MFNPVKSANKIKDDYVSYIRSTFKFNDPDLNRQFVKKLSENISKGPYVDLSDIFETGKTISELMNEGVASYLFSEIEKNKPEYDKKENKYKRYIPLERPLYKHQEEAFLNANKGHNLVITTGTGSGKTECFLYPIINSLLKEKENGTLSNSGIRAILIYPMNALANDQMKRLRSMLMYYEDITFGVFNGETKNDTFEAVSIYKNLHRNEKEEKLKEPIRNELVSREQMLQNPPHILITNYAELERLLFVPKNDTLFNDNKLKFIVLDEAHVYKGATGMETAMLLKRLRARLNKQKGEIQYFLTSATLGKKNESEKEIVEFANRLTGEDFIANEDVIFSTRKQHVFSNESTEIDVDENFFNEMCENNLSGGHIYEKYNLIYDDKLDDFENLYNVCSRSKFYKILRTNYTGPADVKSIAKWLGISEESAANFIFCCTKSKKNGDLLVDGRFHFFIKAIEGCYLSLKTNELSMKKIEDIMDDGSINKFFEISMCHNCGDIAIVGNIHKIDGYSYLINELPMILKEHSIPDYFHIIRDEEKFDDDFEDELIEEEEELEDEPKKKKQEKSYWFCPTCGRIESGEIKPNCSHNPEKFLRLKAIKNSSRCLQCNNDKYQRFFFGADAPTSILAMSLYEELPTKDKITTDDDGNLVSFIGGKQFLCFSDSRAEAAFFTTYEDNVYDSFMGRRALAKVINNLKDEYTEENYSELTPSYLVRKITDVLVKNKTFATDLIRPEKKSDLYEKGIVIAWKTIFDQMIGSRRKNSFQSLGMLQFNYLGNKKNKVEIFKNEFFKKASYEEVKNLLDILAMTFVYFGAILLPDDIDAKDSSEIYKYAVYTDVANAIYLQKTSGGSPHYSSWAPPNKPGFDDQWKSNIRSKIVERIIDDPSPANVDKFLKSYFDWLTSFSNENRAVMSTEKPGAYIMPIDNYGIQLEGNINNKWYRCNKCGRISPFNVNGKCLVKGCDGRFEQISNPVELVKDDYYYNVYNNGYLKKLIIKEHTAQLKRETALEYQNKFESNAINALSCSTTFEMGVDVGELETVFLRNIPPTTANYAQRAGRAGRSSESSAFVLTFAKLSSHDFNYFEKPELMISGQILPPVFKLDNAKVVFRHIFSVCLSHFFKNEKFSALYDGKICTFASEEQKGYEKFVEYINSKPKDLSLLLEKTFGEKLSSEFGISDFSGSWVDDLIGENGRLSSGITKYRYEASALDDKVKASEGESQKYHQKNKAFYEGKSVIDFFVDNNVLPKYGFPIDTMTLKQMKGDNRKGNELSLSRDISQGIVDYAPGCKVVANGYMYTSRYINKIPRNGAYSFVKGTLYTCECGSKSFFEVDTNNPVCVGCKKNLALSNEKNNAIEPRGGMTMDGSSKRAPMKRPKKIYRSDATYIGTAEDTQQETYSIKGNKITLKSTKNDEIMITSENAFYVCPKCGYSLGKNDTVKDSKQKVLRTETKMLREGRIENLNLPEKHFGPNGKDCNNTLLEKNYLCHVFKTDVIQILFNNKNFIDEKLMYSLMYALLDAIAYELDIERTDIDGCLKHNVTDKTNISFVIFDNVPGGAGHVKRLMGNDGNILNKIVNRILNKMDCECSDSCYSCLRNYYNQRYHALLNHHAVTDFLSNYSGVMERENDESSADSGIVISQEGLPVIEKQWVVICNQIRKMVTPSTLEKMKKFSNIILPNFMNSTLGNVEGNYKVALVWKDRKVILLKKDDVSLYEKIKDDKEWKVFIADDNINAEKMENILKEEK